VQTEEKVTGEPSAQPSAASADSGSVRQPREAAGQVLDLRVGQRVEVRSPEEILATLDERGELDSLPFMPEMLQYCGRQFTVYKVAHKLCDTLTLTGMRRMENAVHLAGVRCDGGGHDGCQAACLMYWKHAWLKPVEPGTPAPPEAAAPDGTRLLPLLVSASRKAPAEDGSPRYSCQATEILRAAPETVPVRELKQYVRDVRSGNAGVWWTLRAFLVGIFNQVQNRSRALPRWMRFRGGLRWGFLRSTADKTPTAEIGLKPGELVRVRSKEEIMKTLDRNLKNRGMGFDAEMLRFCGRTARVARRIDHIVDERTGRMLHMKNPCIVLEGIVCEGAYNGNCPRAITAYWREIWLERVEESA
jgi:hypothetical protein